MSIIMHYVDRLHEIMDKHADPRTSHWFLISSPFPTLFICLAYVYVVKVLGPKLMENRKPFQLREVLIAYNLFQVMFSAWIFWECLMGGWWSHYSFRCQAVDYSTSPMAMRLAMSGWITGDYSLKCQPIDKSNGRQAMRMAHACWWYYFSKFTEFFDTIFFVLRKKNNHVSALHVIHHGCMPMSVWFGVKFTPGGHSSFFGLLNTFVHIIMYSYYLLAAMGPSIQPYLWWKKYLTALQMVQFVLVMAHAFQLLFIECNYPKAFVWWIGLHAIMFFTLFNEFYKQSYAKEEKSKRNKIETRVEAGAKASNGSVVNGKSAGITNGDGVNSRRRDAADYYVKGESLAASEMHLRKSYTATE